MSWSCGGLEVLGDHEDGVSLEQHLQDLCGLGLEQQVEVIQVQLQGRVSGQEHEGGGTVAGRLDRTFHVGLSRLV